MTSIFISQASSEAASGWSPVYRGLFSTQMEDEDLCSLEHELPDWLAEFLLANKVNGIVGGGGVPGQKFSFMVVPWKSDIEGDEYLPDLLSSQSRLTASRFLRVRKVLGYVSRHILIIQKLTPTPIHSTIGVLVAIILILTNFILFSTGQGQG